MSELTLTRAATPAAITIPVRLPDRADGTPIRHLSASSYNKWLACPEAWRRHYILGERAAPSGAMFLGSRVDDAVSTYYTHLLDTGEAMAGEQVLDVYRDRWMRARAEEAARLGVAWEDELPERHAFALGRNAVTLAMRGLVPRLGTPVAVQRRLELTLAPGLEWTVLAYLDLETVVDGEGGEPEPVVVDFKVRGSLVWQAQADSDPQASLYLAGRWLEGRPACEFRFAQIAKPGKRRVNLTAGVIATRRTAGQLRGMLARLAVCAAQITACHERLGPDAPWGYADPGGWKCSPRWCEHWAACPGGHGL
jgi:hypothetical protein